MAQPRPFPGTPRFEVRRCLGSGGFGTVYEALDRKRNAIIALKVLRQASPSGIYRFKQEFRSLSGVTHHNLVTLYELLTEGEQWFFSMELVQGTDFVSYHRDHDIARSATAVLSSDDSISRYVPTMMTMATLSGDDTFNEALDAKQRPVDVSVAPTQLPIERLLHTLQQLSEGLLFLHDQGFIHRDIKPARITSVD